MHFADLTPCTYFDALAFDRPVLAVGWLEPGYPYPTGHLDSELVSALEFLIDLHGQPFFCGRHVCGFCASQAGSLTAVDYLAAGGRDTFIQTADGRAYLAFPELITHYMSVHGYAPPDELREALRAPRPLDLTS